MIFVSAHKKSIRVAFGRTRIQHLKVRLGERWYVRWQNSYLDSQFLYFVLSLIESETAMLEKYCVLAGVKDGMHVVDLGKNKKYQNSFGANLYPCLTV
jgi:hypothetical protein